MASHGGARNRSGPPADPNSARSEQRGLSYQALPNEGYQGEIPEFPQGNADETILAYWNWAWRTPQAAAWIHEPYLMQSVARWARLSALCESADARASDFAQVNTLEGNLGLNHAGMRFNGWSVAKPQISPDQSDSKQSSVEGDAQPERRMRAV